MVNIINKSVCRGVAGKRSGGYKGVVMHNTWDNSTAQSHIDRLSRMTVNQLAAGFAHYYIDENDIVRVEDTYNGAWHTANTEGNMYYIGFEIRGNRSTPRAVFLQAEQNACWQAAIDLKFQGLAVNRNTVRLHHEFSATECPKRSLIEHCGYDSTYAVPIAVTNKMKDYYITQIKKYYVNPSLKPDGKVDTTVKPVTPTVKPTETAKPSANTFKVGDSVKITGSLYKDSYGKGASTAKRGSVGKVKKVNSKGSKPYLIEAWGWAAKSDITLSNTSTVSKPVPVIKGSNLSSTGYYTVPVATNIRSAASTSAPVVGLYNKGEGFNYDSKVTAGGYVWLSYISYSGQRRYVAVV